MIDAGDGARALVVGDRRCRVQRHRDVQRIDVAVGHRRRRWRLVGHARWHLVRRRAGLTAGRRGRSTPRCRRSTARCRAPPRPGRRSSRRLMPMFWQLGAVAPQSFFRLLKVVPGLGLVAPRGRVSERWPPPRPGGAVAVRLAAWAAGTVPGRTWKKRNVLVGTDTAFVAVTAALMALTLVRVLNVAGSVVAITSTFHHSGRPPLRVPTTWSWAGIGTFFTLVGDGLPGQGAGDPGQVDGRRVVDAGGGGRALGRRRVREQRHRDVEGVLVGGVPERGAVNRCWCSGWPTDRLRPRSRSTLSSVTLVSQ